MKATSYKISDLLKLSLAGLYQVSDSITASNWLETPEGKINLKKEINKNKPKPSVRDLMHFGRKTA